jgi:hypothetical protein
MERNAYPSDVSDDAWTLAVSSLPPGVAAAGPGARRGALSCELREPHAAVDPYKRPMGWLGGRQTTLGLERPYGRGRHGPFVSHT